MLEVHAQLACSCEGFSSCPIMRRQRPKHVGALHALASQRVTWAELGDDADGLSCSSGVTARKVSRMMSLLT